MTIPLFPELLAVTLPEASSLPSDSDLVRRVLAGEVEAFGVLVDRHHARCLRVAAHLLGSPDDAEDVVQDAFLRAYRHLAGYRERERFGAWLVRIVVNQCRTRSTREARYASLESLPQGFEEIASGADDALDHALDAEHQRLRLAAALAQLPFEQREAVVLRYADALSYQDMATVTGAGVSALKMRVQRACERLRALLAEQLS